MTCWCDHRWTERVQFDCTNGAIVSISVTGLSFRDDSTNLGAFALPAREHDDLKRAPFRQAAPESVHPRVVAPDEPVVKNKSSPKILSRLRRSREVWRSLPDSAAAKRSGERRAAETFVRLKR
jgi:hypothetical protein